MGHGFDSLADKLTGHSQIRIDGYVGTFWESFREQLQEALSEKGIQVNWIDVSQAQKPAAIIEAMVKPFLGGDDPLFGKRFPGKMLDFFDADRLGSFQPDPESAITILFGCGAALVEWESPLIYVDLPKNELQYRSRAGSVCNLGLQTPIPPKEQYKQFYFVDWQVLNRHKLAIIGSIDWFVDDQRPCEPTFVSGNGLREALIRMSRNVFRARPWFEAGPWGGQWLKKLIPQLPQHEPNYAWSFELITPENGLAFTDGRVQIEVSFDWLMYHSHREVLGESADRFGYDFPIRFDFLDTFDGGNLSLQCHPYPEYALEQFGEPFTQDETYYILDCKPGAEVYLGFRQNINSEEFHNALESSFRDSTPVDVKEFVNTVPARQHDLLLIPHGTIHCSGENILVLEISATPYIFTFKMYDWLRLGLDGVARPLNINRAFENLNFDRQGEEARRQLLSRPEVIAQGEDWSLVHLPTHPDHFYDVHRYEFETAVTGQTDGSVQVLMLVDGTGIEVSTHHGMVEQFYFGETFVVPAAAISYKLVNLGQRPAKVIKAFIKSP
ncbi:putative mannose-6-phosphate isomerase GmuF [Bythopirellula polymerisocia]|uniref:Putative mannose-6-phosphate isomerase GmuF n=1 Tax=Bythopirellula polymerisocia TaxID=2528003 RepID=A0A5C6CV62_9BACT|nr:putative mannose-6-phosphate isomerase GmuF [Bythopirellula polymerisocia]